MYASWPLCNRITYRGQVPVTTPLHLSTVFILRSDPPKQDVEFLERVHSYYIGDPMLRTQSRALFFD